MKVQENAEAQASHEAGKALHKQAVLDQCAAAGQVAPQLPRQGYSCEPPVPHRQATAVMSTLNQAVDAGHGVAVDDVPDAVGKEQHRGTRKHQGADDGSVHS